jgi:hypothetical protein
MPLDPMFSSKVKVKEPCPPNPWWRNCNCRFGRGNGGYWKGRTPNRDGRAKGSHALRLC